MDRSITRRRVLAGLSVVSVSALAGCPGGDEDTPPATSAATSTATSTPPTDTPTPPTNRLRIPAGETHTIGGDAVESYLSVEWGAGAELVLEPGGALELTTET
jgi:hypothetical protein